MKQLNPVYILKRCICKIHFSIIVPSSSKLLDVSEVLTASRAIIALMMEAVSNSERSANFYQTAWRNIPEDNHLHTRCLSKNLKIRLKIKIPR
jgi:hypothetical protein